MSDYLVDIAERFRVGEVSAPFYAGALESAIAQMHQPHTPNVRSHECPACTAMRSLARLGNHLNHKKAVAHANTE